MMTPTTLQALRRLLFYSIPEAAEHIGQRSERAWRMWERGELPVPDDVAERLRDLVAWRAQAIEAAETARADAQAAHGAASDAALVWYDGLDDWMRLPGRVAPLWRPHCSAVAELAARGPWRLVPFDAADYFAWLGRRADSETTRAEWAAHEPSSNP